MKPPARQGILFLTERRLLEDHQVDRPDVYVWQHTQLTGTNSRTLRRIDPLLGPTNHGTENIQSGTHATIRELQLLPLPENTSFQFSVFSVPSETDDGSDGTLKTEN